MENKTKVKPIKQDISEDEKKARQILELEQNLGMSQRVLNEYVKEVQTLTHRLMLANTKISLLEEQVKNSVPIEEITDENREEFLNDLEG